MGQYGPVALNMLAIEQAMKDYGVSSDEKIDFSLKVRQIANIIFAARSEDLNRRMKSK